MIEIEKPLADALLAGGWKEILAFPPRTRRFDHVDSAALVRLYYQRWNRTWLLEFLWRPGGPELHTCRDQQEAAEWVHCWTERIRRVMEES